MRTTTSSRTSERSHPRIHVAEPLDLLRPRRRGDRSAGVGSRPAASNARTRTRLATVRDRLLVPAAGTGLEDDLREAREARVLDGIVADRVRHHAVGAGEVGHVPSRVVTRAADLDTEIQGTSDPEDLEEGRIDRSRLAPHEGDVAELPAGSRLLAVEVEVGARHRGDGGRRRERCRSGSPWRSSPAAAVEPSGSPVTARRWFSN